VGSGLLDHEPRWLGPLALATIYVVWGSTYLAIRVVVEDVPPLLASGSRFVLAASLLAAVVAWRSGRSAFRVPRAELAGAAAISVLTLVVPYALVFAAETEVPSGLTALLIASVPLWVVVLRLVARERVGAATLAAVVLGFGGVALVVRPGDTAPLGWMLAVVAAALCEAVGSYLLRKARLPRDLIVSATVQMLAAGMLTLLVALALGEAGDLDADALTAESVAAFLYLVVAGSALAYTAFVWLLRHAPLSTATTYAYVNPVVAVLLGWAILDEEITWTIAAGAAAIVLAVAVVVRRER
jgi:drug/metabolite transporter (DMT)-like permease